MRASSSFCRSLHRTRLLARADFKVQIDCDLTRAVLRDGGEIEKGSWMIRSATQPSVPPARTISPPRCNLGSSLQVRLPA